MMHIRHHAIFATLLLAVFLSNAVGAGKPVDATVVEFSKPLPKPDFQGTVSVDLTDAEQPFAKRITEEPVDHWAETIVPPPAGETETAGQTAAKKKAAEDRLAVAKAHTLAGQDGKYVGWFGIVRGLAWDEHQRRTELLIEHKHQDGSSDPGILVVSIRGGGDFKASLPEHADSLKTLQLVRIYGVVSIGKDGVPVVAAEHVRVWDWGLFTFMPYGIDRSAAKWKAMRPGSDEDVYTPRPRTDYYEKWLGKRDAEMPAVPRQ